MSIEIKNRTGQVIKVYEQANTVKEAVEQAIKENIDLRSADLRSANLYGANLYGADLSSANLRSADLSSANLYGADLYGADLSSANLRSADLSSANLYGADLSSANLRSANLRSADLSSANLYGADLSSADLYGADLSSANLRSAKGIRAPIIPNIDAAILAKVNSDGCKLDMANWHVCETTHCRAGWAIHLAGDAGYMLEDRVGPAIAGALIYAASRPNKPIPDFYASQDDAMNDLIACAAESPLPTPAPSA